MKNTRIVEYSILNTLEQVEDYFAALSKDLFLVFDTETTGLTYDDELLGISLYQHSSSPHGVYISSYDSFESESIKKYLFSILQEYKWVGHNALFDKFIFSANDIGNPPVFHDSMVLIHLWDSNLEKNLEKRVRLDFKYEKKTFEEIIGKKWNRIDWEVEYDDHKELLAEYAVEDVYWTYRLFVKYHDLLKSDERLYKLYTKIELPLQDVLLNAKLKGIKINVDLLNKMEGQVGGIIDKIKESLYEEVGQVFNLNSPKQKSKIFIEELGMPVVKLTKTKNPSTDSDSMEQWAEMGCKPAEYMVEYSEVQKLYSSYITSIPNLLSYDGQLRGNLNPCGTKTGRFSSNEPNLQNMPNNDNFPVRKSFIPRDGYAFICLDFSQIEPRIMAHMSRDEGLMHIYNKPGGGDIYKGIADDLYITRKQAKVVVLAISYGMGPQKLANSLGITIEEAEIIIMNFYKTYPRFEAWKSSVERKAENEGYARNLFGRVRRFNFSSRKDPAYWGSLRQAFNSVVQGSAADFLKLCMIRLHANLMEYNDQFDSDANILCQVHDELLVECKIEYAREIYEITRHHMENTHKFRVPIIAEGKVCFEWSQMKNDDIGEFDLLDNPPLPRITTILNDPLLLTII